MRKLLVAVCAFASGIGTAASRFSFLDPYETPPARWTREAPPTNPSPAPPPLQIDLSPFHQLFRKEGTVKVFYGLGYEAYRSTSAQSIFDMLRTVTNEEKLPLGGFTMNDDETLIEFRNRQTGVKFEVTLGNERNAFGNAFAGNAIVMYHGHSRYGRGPAFRSFSNYFRMGDVFDTIEVDTRNTYFRNEPMQLVDQYPPIASNFGDYQYRGQKVDSSYLPNDAYTKNIPGGAIDLINAGFRPGKQLIWLYSCSNVFYYKGPMRKRFPDANEKPVFGTLEEGMWSEKPAAIFLAEIAAEETSSQKIVDLQNATGDCKDCFTVY